MIDETTTWTYGVVAFLDILGFANFVAEDARSERPVHLERLRSCLSEIQRTDTGLTFLSFSDSVVLTSSLSGAAFLSVVTTVAKLQRNFIRNGVLVRGGIAFGKHFSGSEILYSEALVRAYQLERDHARFPRVLVESDLLDWFMNNDVADPNARAACCALLLRDRDARAFVHYLDEETLGAHTSLLNEHAKREVTASVVEKLQWLAAYHNHVAGNRLGLQVSGTLASGYQAIDAATLGSRRTADR